MSTPAAAPSDLETADLLRERLRQGDPVWLTVGTLFDGERVQRESHLVFDRSEILHVGDAWPAAMQAKLGRAEPDLRLPQHVLLPGLIDAHTHLFLEGGEEDPGRRAAYLKNTDEALLRSAEERLPRMRRAGVLAVRDAGDRNGVGLALQARYRSQRRGAMPYLDSPGAAIHHQGRYGTFMGRPVEEHGEVETCIAARVREGAHRIKILATGIINFEKGAVVAKPQFSVEELTRAVAAARAHGRQTMIHCSGHDGVALCVAARVDTIEHGFFVDSEQLRLLRDLDIAWVPTFAPVQFQVDAAATLGWSDAIKANLQRILDAHAARLAEAGRLGVRIVAGSDAGSHGVPHAHGFFRELELMQAAGLSAVEVLRSATGASAARLGLAEDVGRLRVGAKARFLLTPAPVLDHVRHLRAPMTVVFDGEIETGGDDPAVPGM